MHVHHIMPRHLGGSNDLDNLVEVSVEEHAEIHRCLWIYGGRWQDELAWRILSGQVGKDDIMKKIRTENGKRTKNLKRGNPNPKPTIRGENNPAKRPDVRAKISKACRGLKRSEETKQKIREYRTGRNQFANAKSISD